MSNAYKELIKNYEDETKRLQGEVSQLMEMIEELGGTGDSGKLKEELKEKDLEINVLKLEVKKKGLEAMKFSAQKEMLMHAFL